MKYNTWLLYSMVIPLQQTFQVHHHNRITNRRSDKSVMKQTFPYKHFSFEVGKLATDSSSLSFRSRQCAQIKRFWLKSRCHTGDAFTTASIVHWRITWSNDFDNILQMQCIMGYMQILPFYQLLVAEIFAEVQGMFWSVRWQNIEKTHCTIYYFMQQWLSLFQEDWILPNPDAELKCTT